jgi:hypothetical protein
VEFPDKERRIVRRCVSQREDESLRTKARTRVFTAVFISESCVNAICARLGTRVERHAQCALIPQDLTRRRTSARARFPGRTRPLAITPRGHLRPDKRGRERPPSERGGGRPPGVAEGVAHAPSSRSTIIRATSAAAQSAAAFSMPATAHPLVRQRVAASASSERRHHHPFRFGVQFSGVKGDNSYPRRCPPFCPPCPSARAAIN